MGHLGGVGLDLMLARLAPHDKADMGSGSVPERHGWAEIGFHLNRATAFWLASLSAGPQDFAELAIA
jgi:hypothetical protein